MLRLDRMGIAAIQNVDRPCNISGDATPSAILTVFRKGGPTVPVSNERLLLKEVTKWLVYTALLSLIVLCLVYIYLSWQAAHGNLAIISGALLKDSVTQFIPLTILFLISSLLLSRYSEAKARIESSELSQQVRRELEGVVRRALYDQDCKAPLVLHEKFDDIDWARALKDASRLDVIIHYLDNWTRNVSPSLQNILANGGTIRVFVPSYQQPELISVIKTRHPTLSAAELKAKITKTHERLCQLLTPLEQDSRGSVETRFVNKLIWYSAFCVDDHVLFLSPFEHERALRVEAPVTEIELDAYPAVKLWLHSEMAGLSAATISSKKA